MLQFRPIEQFLFSPELGEYRSFGIQAFSVSPTGAEEVSLISDVSCDPAFVSRLAEKCTQLQLDPVHLLDVVLDALP